MLRLWIISLSIACMASATNARVIADESAITAEQSQANVEQFLTILKAQPRFGTTFDRVRSFQQEQGTLDEFVAGLEQQAEQDDTGSIELLAGLFRQRSGDDAEAVRLFEIAESQRGDDPLAAWMLGRSQRNLGRFDDAVKSLERALARNPLRTDVVSVTRELVAAMRRTKDRDRIAEVWKSLEQKLPDDPRVIEDIAAAMLEGEDLEGALARYSRLAKSHPDIYQRTIHALTAADLKRQLGRGADALADLEQLLSSLDSKSWLARETRDQIEATVIDAGPTTDLIGYYETWLESHDDDLDAMTRLASLLRRAGRIEDAERWLTNAIALAPTDVQLRLELIELLVQRRQLANTVAQYELILQTESGNSDHAIALGRLWMTRLDIPLDDRRQRAAEVWLRCLEGHADDAVAVIRHADLLMEAGLTDDAVTFHRRAVELAPLETRYREDLGAALHKLNRTDDALTAWNSIAEDDRRTAANFERLSDVLKRFGFHEEAVQAFRSACELDPEPTQRVRFAKLLTAEFLRLASDASAASHNSGLAAAPQSRRAGSLPNEALAQLDRAEREAANDDERQTTLEQRLETLSAFGLLAAEVDLLAAEVQAATIELKARQTRPVTDVAVTSDAAALARRWFVLAQYRMANAQLPDAIAAIVNALEWNPTDIRAARYTAMLYEAGNRLADAADTRRRLVEMDRQFMTDHLKAIAELELRLGRFDMAIAAAESLLATAPGDADYAKLLADLLQKDGRPAEALRTLRRALRSNPRDTEVAIVLARALVEQQQPSEAIDVFWQAFDQSDSTNERVGIVTQLATIAVEQNSFEAVIQRLRSTARDEDGRRESAACLAAAWKAAGDVSAARTELSRLAESDPQNTELIAQVASLAESEGDLEAAAKSLRRLHALEPDGRHRSHLANLLMQLGETTEAEALFAASVNYEGPREELFAMVDQLLTIDSSSAAAAVLENLLRREPENWEAMSRLGLLHWHAGRREEALVLFDRILALKLPAGTLAVSSVSREVGRDLRNQMEMANGANFDSAPDSVWRMMRTDALGALLRPMSEDELTAAANNSFYNNRAGQFVSEESVRIPPQDFGEARIVAHAARMRAGRIDDSDLQTKSPEQLDSLTPEERIDLLTISLLKTGFSMGSDDSSDSWLMQLTASLAKSGDPDWQATWLSLRAKSLYGQRFPQIPNLPNDGRAPEQLDFDVYCFKSLLDTRPDLIPNTAEHLIANGHTLNGSVTRFRELTDQLTSNADSPTHRLAGLRLMYLASTIRSELFTGVEMAEVLMTLGDPPPNTPATAYWQNGAVLQALSEPAPSIQHHQLQTAHQLAQSMRVVDLGALPVNAVLQLCAQDSVTISKLLDWQLERLMGYSGTSFPLVAPDDDQRQPNTLLSSPRFDSRIPLDALSVVGFAQNMATRDAANSESRFHEQWYAAAMKKAESNSDVDTSHRRRLLIELFASSMASGSRDWNAAIRHLIRAVELDPEDVSLRWQLVNWCSQAQRFEQALALLDKMPDHDPMVLKAREHRALELATSLRNFDRARLAAERLYGMRLNGAESEDLIRELTKLGLSELADDLRTRHPVDSRQPMQSRAGMSIVTQFEDAVSRKDQPLSTRLALQIVRRTSNPVAAESFARMVPELASKFGAVMELRTAALEVLKDAGELDRLIDQGQAQLIESPKSRLLLKSQVELLNAAGRTDEATELRKQLGELTSKSAPKSLLIEALQHFQNGSHDSAVDAFLHLYRTAPNVYYANSNQAWQAIVASNRTAEIGRLLLESDLSSADVSDSHICLVILHGTTAEATPEDKDISKKLMLAWLSSRDGEHDPFAGSRLNAVRELGAEACLEILTRLAIPTDTADVRRCAALWISSMSHRSQLDMALRVDPIVNLLSASGWTPELRQQLNLRIAEARRQFPEWKSGLPLQWMCDVHVDGQSSVHAELLQSLHGNSGAMEVGLLERLASAYPRAPLFADFVPLMREAYRQSLKEGPRPAVRLRMMLMDYDSDRSRRDAVRPWIHERLALELESPLLSDVTMPGTSSSAVTVMNQAAGELTDLGFPVDALRVLFKSKRDEDDAATISQSQHDVAQGMLEEELMQWRMARNDAAVGISAGSLLEAVQLDLAAKVMPSVAMPFDLTIERSGILQQSIDSQLLAKVRKERMATISTQELTALANASAQFMERPDADASLVLLTAWYVLATRDAAGVPVITPPLQSWLERWSSNPATVNDAERSARFTQQLLLAIIARELPDDETSKPLKDQLLQTAIEAARDWPDKRWLAALLSERGHRLLAAGDAANAEAAWDELLNLMLQLPDESEPASVDRKSSSQSIDLDLDAELRRQLLAE